MLHANQRYLSITKSIASKVALVTKSDIVSNGTILLHPVKKGYLLHEGIGIEILLPQLST
jgi:hypothetical protein